CLMAFSNSRDGGYILMGVEQRDGRYVAVGVEPAHVASFDPTPVGDFARGFCSLLPEFMIQPVEVDGVLMLLATVIEFIREPIVCTSNLHDERNQPVLRAGAVYVRTDDAKCVEIQTAHEMQALLRLAVGKQ